MIARDVRPLTPADRSAWAPLWAGYQTFYQTVIPAATTDRTWQRFHDPGCTHARAGGLGRCAAG
jgi:hypothetical protein